MSVLKSLFCKFFGYCQTHYDPSEEPLEKRYNSIELRMRWMPRDLLDIGR